MRRSPATRILLAALAVASTALPVPPALSAGLPGATVIHGRDADPLRNRPTASFRVYAVRDGEASPVPFQVDEQNRRDRWVLDQGAETDPDESPGVLDRNDTIVVLNRDLGERARTEVLPPGARVWAEVRVGPRKKPVGFVYVGSFTFPPPLVDSPPHAAYDPTLDRIEARRYAVGFDAPLPTHLSIVDAGGGVGANLIAGIHASGEASLLGGLMSFQRDDSHIHEELEGTRNGPLRVIRRGDYDLELPLGLRAGGHVSFLFYGDFVEVAARLNVKVPAWLVRADGAMEATIELVDTEESHPLFAGSLPGTSERKGEHSGPWAAVRLPGGETLLVALRLGGDLSKMNQEFYSTRAQSAPGVEHLLFGFRLSEANRLGTGVHPFALIGAFLGDASPDELENAARWFLDPPQVSVGDGSRFAPKPNKL